MATTGELAAPAVLAPKSGRARARVFARRHGFVLLVGAALLAGLLLRIAIGATDDAATTDETAYLRSGAALVDGEGFEREPGKAELHFPPLVPLLLGLAGRVFEDPHTGTVWLTILAGTALVLPAALLARRIGGPLAGVTAGWVAALAPALSTMLAVRGAGSEAEYVLLVVGAVWCAVSSADHDGWARLVRVAGAGLLVGLAYLTRPEGLLVALPVGIAVVVVAVRRTTGRGPRLGAVAATGAAFAVPLMACIVPYASYLHDHTGRWELTAKTQDASIEAWHGVASGNRQARDRVLYTPDESGLHFSTARKPLPTLAREDPRGYLRIFGANVWTLLRNIVGFNLLSLPVWLLAGFGAWRARTSGAVALLVAVAMAPVATTLAFFVQPRYLVVTAAVAAILVGVAVARLPERFRRGAAIGVVGLVAVPGVFAFHGLDGWWHPNETTDMRQAGEWIEGHTDPDELVMTRSFVVQYYAERPVLAIPYAELDEIMQWARHYGARYLVVDTFTALTVRPQLEPLMYSDRWPGLELVHEVHADGATTRVFALDPPPPPSDEIGPSLGFIGDA